MILAIPIAATTLLEQGGPVLWLLGAVSLLGFLLFVERTLYLHQGQIKPAEFVQGIKNLLAKGRVNESLTVCGETPGPVAAVARATIRNLSAGEGRLRAAVQDAALVEIPFLERRIGTIGVLAKVAPMIGLLGTGVAAFEMLGALESAGSYANSAFFAGYLREALLTTCVGLAIGVMAHLAHHFLHGRVRALVHDMEWVALNLMEYALAEYAEEADVAHAQGQREEMRSAPAVESLSPKVAAG